MRNNTLTLALAAGAATVLTAAVAFAETPQVGSTLGTDADGVSAALVAAGYDVIEVEVEDDEIEVLASLDGATYEIEVRLSDGVVVEVELEDADEDEDED